MSIVPADSEATLAALDIAADLADMGVPIFTCRLNSDGDPIPPKDWQNTAPDPDRVDRWKPGMGLCAVTGAVFDVIDIDPRNGGSKSFKKLAEALGDDGPEVYWEVRTPSGGIHLWVAPMKLGSHNGVMPGVDLKGDNDEGSSRGFVFLPPTVRPSKTSGKRAAYTAKGLPGTRSDSGHVEPIQNYLAGQLNGRASSSGKGKRTSPDILRKECIKAEHGEQRTALLRYVRELEKSGTQRDDILRLLSVLVKEMPQYDVLPWRTRDLQGLLDRPGKIMADAVKGEIEGIQPITAGLIRWAHEAQRKFVSWLWEEYIALGELTLLDGEKGVAKSGITDYLVACATRGLPFPGCDEAVCDPINVIYFTDEGTLETILIPRLQAVKADLSRIAYQGWPENKKGKVKGSWDVALPEGAPIIQRMTAESGAQLAIFDPITDLMGEGIHSHEDASVRRALRPLAIAMSELGCAGWMIRHMNKDTKADAKYRGSGSMAYQNRARVHLVATEIPGHIKFNSGTDGDYALAMVDTNLTAKRPGALTYSVVDSDIELDDHGRYVGCVEWRGWTDIDVLRGDPKRHGQTVSPEREQAGMILEEMFSEKDTWGTKEVEDALKEAGAWPKNGRTRAKIYEEMGIRSTREYGEGGSLKRWVLTTQKRKVG